MPRRGVAAVTGAARGVKSISNLLAGRTCGHLEKQATKRDAVRLGESLWELRGPES